MTDVAGIVKTACAGRSWVVVVTPEQDVTDWLRQLSLVEGGTFSGRTLTTVNGGKVSIGSGSEPVFVPDGVPFSVMFRGWHGRQSDGSLMSHWRAAAESVIRP